MSPSSTPRVHSGRPSTTPGSADTRTSRCGGATATPEAKAAAAKQLGLDGSYPSQYWRWIKGIFHGDMGHSLLSNRPISDIVKTALPITLELIILGLLIAVLIGIPLGVISAVK